MPTKKFRIYRDSDKWSQNKDSIYFSKVNRELIETTGFPLKYFVLENYNADQLLGDLYNKVYDLEKVPEIYAWWEGDDPLIELERAGLVELIIEKILYVNKYRFHELFDTMPKEGDIIYISYLDKYVEIKEVREYQHRHGHAYYSTMYALSVEDLKLDGTTNMPIDTDDIVIEESGLNEFVENATNSDGVGSGIGSGDDYIDWIDTSDYTNADEEAIERARKDKAILNKIFPDEVL